MNTNDNKTQSSGRSARRRLFLWTVGIALGIVLLSAMPGAWALPSQSPDYQTVPLPTSTPTSPGSPTNTPGPGGPTETPGSAQPTDTSAPGQPTNTPPPGSTPTATATTATATRAAVSTTPVLPSNCWAVPTPGFSPQSAGTIGFTVESDQFLVVPGQQVSLRYVITNEGVDDLTDLLVCAPLEPILGRGQVSASDGSARLVADGLIFELAELAVGDTATVEVNLTVPATAALGSVIENQAWLFADGIRASTDLLTWALPPAFLPPTGRQGLSCGQR